MTTFGYARVSSPSQHLTIQENALRAFGCDDIRSEKRSAVTLDKRDALKGLLADLKAGDTLVVTRVCRLSRSYRDVLNIVDQLDSVGATLQVIEQPVDLTTATGKFNLGILCLTAEYEANTIQERTVVGLEHARQRGVKLGGYRGVPMKDGVSALGRKAHAASVQAKAADRAVKLMPLIEALKSSGFTSYAQLATGLNEQGSTSPRGKGWTPSAVRLEVMRAAA
jgi:DNA invertase Pin-like site-specific DNA recombinase